MALTLGELSIGLELENDRLRAGMGQAKRELQTLPPVARQEMAKVSRIFEDEGRKSGGTLAKGINQGLIRNSPLIVAGVGAALAAGAPAMAAAAGALFGGVGAVAAAQTLEVRSAWSNLGRDIRDGAVEDAAVLVPVYTEMADRIGGAFRDMRPQLREAFADSAPLVRSFTDGVLALAQNAMPGLLRTVSSAGPVFEGLEHFLSATGTGLSGFFDAINGHAPAAGSAFASLGDIVGSLLPILGELLGQGAELAADVLPMVSGALGVVLDVTQALGPALPVIAQGFLALKVAQSVTGWVGGLGTAIDNLATKAGASSLAGGRLSTTLTGVGRAAPVVGAAVGLLGVAWAKGEQEMDDYSRKLDTLFAQMTQGGKAGQDAAASLEVLRAKVEDVGDGFGMFGSELPDRLRDAQAAFDRTQASMSALDLAQQRVTAATNDYQYAVGESGPRSADAARASNELESAQAALTREQERLEFATNGVTAAMVDQANQALAAIDAGFGYRQSLFDLSDAQVALNEAVESGTASAGEIAELQLDVEQANFRAAESYARHQAELSGLSEDSAEYARFIQEQMLTELYRLQSAAGPEMAAAIGRQISALEASGVALSGTATSAASTAQRMRDLGLSVIQVPGSKTVFIDAPTADQKRRLEDLGYVVRTLPNGRVYVTADTSPAQGSLEAFLSQRRSISIAVNTVRGTTYQGVGQQPDAATGGRIRDVVRGFSGGGKLSGPGTPTSDDIPALTYAGSPLRVSTEEWVIQARAAAMYGDAAMAAVNAGTARITAPGLAAGGSVGPATRAVAGVELNVGTVNLIEGTPRDVAQELTYLGRTRGG